MLLVHLDSVRKVFDARGAPGGPEIDQDNVALVLRNKRSQILFIASDEHQLLGIDLGDRIRRSFLWRGRIGSAAATGDAEGNQPYQQQANHLSLGYSSSLL